MTKSNLLYLRTVKKTFLPAHKKKIIFTGVLSGILVTPCQGIIEGRAALFFCVQSVFSMENDSFLWIWVFNEKRSFSWVYIREGGRFLAKFWLLGKANTVDEGAATVADPWFPQAAAGPSWLGACCPFSRRAEKGNRKKNLDATIQTYRCRH